MRVTRLVVAIAVVSVLVLSGGITAGLILARDQAPPVASPKAVGSGSEAAATQEPTLAPPVTTEPEHLTMPEPDPKSAADSQTGLSPEGPEGARPAMEGASPGTVYTWQDGDRTMKVVLQQPQQTVQENVDGAAEDGAARKGELDSIVRGQSASDGGQPVFRSQSGGELMTLPGGVNLALDPQWDQAAVEAFFSRNGISLDRVSELDFLVNGFFVETDPGLSSLELANALAGQDGVILSSPNWAREVESR